MPARSQVPLPAGEWWRGRVGTLQPAACPAVIASTSKDNPLVYSASSLVSPWQHPLACSRSTGCYTGHMPYSSLSCATQLPAHGARRAVLPQSLAAQSQRCPFLRVAVTHLRQAGGGDFGRGWVAAVFDQISILRRELACLVPRSILLYLALPCAQGRRPRVAASPGQPLRHSAAPTLHVPTRSRSAGGINIEAIASQSTSQLL